MEGRLVSLHWAKLVEGPSGSRDHVPGRLGVFSYGGAGEPGDLCLFAPDDSALLGGRAKLRPGPGTAAHDGDLLRFSVGTTGKSYVWEIGHPISNSAEVREFLDLVETNDRIIRHLLEGARLLGE